MKKILCAFFLLLLAVLSLAACGKTPKIEISADGYWVIDGEKTDVKAQGDKGEAGEKGDKGDPGEKGEAGDSASDENPLGLAFFLKDDGTYAVEIGYAKYLSNVEIPATYKGKPVTMIGEAAFFGCDNLKSVTIPDSVTVIGDSAFYGCDSLTSVTIGSSVTTIGDFAFYNCDSLTSVYYHGTAEEWLKISIGYDRYDYNLTRATRYYYSEEAPTEEGKFWHYVNGEIVIWED